MGIPTGLSQSSHTEVFRKHNFFNHKERKERSGDESEKLTKSKSPSL